MGGTDSGVGFSRAGRRIGFDCLFGYGPGLDPANGYHDCGAGFCVNEWGRVCA